MPVALRRSSRPVPGQGDAEDVRRAAAYDEADDFELVDCADALSGDLDHGAFVLFMAGEPHKPTLLYGTDGPSPVRKICFKLIVDELF